MEVDRAKAIKDNGLALLGQFMNDPLDVRLDRELKAKGMTHAQWYQSSVAEVMSWSGLTREEVENALRSSQGEYAGEVLEALKNSQE